MQQLAGKTPGRKTACRQIVFHYAIDSDPCGIVAAIPVNALRAAFGDQRLNHLARAAGSQNEPTPSGGQCLFKRFKRMMQPPRLRGAQGTVAAPGILTDIHGKNRPARLIGSGKRMIVAEPQILAEPYNNG